MGMQYKCLSIWKKIGILAGIAVIAIVISTSVAHAKEGAKAQAVDQQGNPIGPQWSLPDCRSCPREQTGPNTFKVEIPQPVKEKIWGGSQPKNKDNKKSE